MSINALTSQFFHVDFRSVCGCRFNLAGGVGSTVIHIASEDTRVTRVLSPAVPGLMSLRHWFVVVAADFAQFAHRASTDDAGLPQFDFHEAVDLPVMVTATLVDEKPDHVRLELTMLADDHDSLDYCHITVTVDLALREFLKEVARAAATGGDLQRTG